MIVAGITLVSMSGVMGSAKDKSEEAFIKTLEDAISMYIDSDGRNLSYTKSTGCTIDKSHKKGVVIKKANDITFNTIINSSYKPLDLSDFVNPANKEYINKNGKTACETAAKITLYRDEDFVYYYKFNPDELGCLTSSVKDTTVKNLPSGCNGQKYKLGDIMIIILMIISLVIDIVSKIIVTNNIIFGEEISIIKDFMYMTYVRNTGIAWSIFSNKQYMIVFISMLIIIGIIWYIYKNNPKNKIEKVSYGLILGGAMGNFIDRIIHGYVIDFIDIRIFGYNYPIFNLADTFIVSGVILLIIYTWRYGRDGDRSK